MVTKLWGKKNDAQIREYSWHFEENPEMYSLRGGSTENFLWQETRQRRFYGPLVFHHGNTILQKL